jgi:hypothetical protein
VIRGIEEARARIPKDAARGVAPFVVEFGLFDIWLVGYYDVGSQLVLVATRELPLSPTIPKNTPVTRAAMYRLGSTAQSYNGHPN